ncbi:MAG: hypothetical protein WC358_07000 [Ignavibacteria bacterium]|jgi:hypothetical protein
MKKITQFIGLLVEMIIISFQIKVFAEDKEVISNSREARTQKYQKQVVDNVIDSEIKPPAKDEKKDDKKDDEKKDEEIINDDEVQKVTFDEKEFSLEDAATFIDNMKEDETVKYEGKEYKRSEIAKLLQYEPAEIKKDDKKEDDVKIELTGKIKLGTEEIEAEEMKNLLSQLEEDFPSYDSLPKADKEKFFNENRNELQGLSNKQIAERYNEKYSVDSLSETALEKNLIRLRKITLKESNVKEGEKFLQERQKNNAEAKKEFEKNKTEFEDKIKEEKAGIKETEDAKKELQKLKTSYETILAKDPYAKDSDGEYILEEKERNELSAQQKFIEMQGGIERVDKAIINADKEMKEINDTIRKYESNIQYFEYEILVKELQTFGELSTKRHIGDIWDDLKAEKEVPEDESMKMAIIQDIITRYKQSKSPLTIARYYKVYKNTFPGIDKLSQHSKSEKETKIEKVDLKDLKLKSLIQRFKEQSKKPIKLPSKQFTVSDDKKVTKRDRKAYAKQVGTVEHTKRYEG